MDKNSLAYSKWNCKYHIVFAPKYRRQIVYIGVSSFTHNESPLMYLLSYIRGDFVYCPVLLVLFNFMLYSVLLHIFASDCLPASGLSPALQRRAARFYIPGRRPG